VIGVGSPPIRLGDRDLRLAAGLLVGAVLARASLAGEAALPCPLRTLTGIPCPLRGMTTSVTETVELDLPDAVAANPAGVGLVGVAIAVLLGHGRRLAVRPGFVYFPLVAMWLWELHRFAVI
jgi:hypothetical protein